jgi:hypothetical protein
VETRRGADKLPAAGLQTKDGPEGEWLRKKRIKGLNKFLKDN